MESKANSVVTEKRLPKPNNVITIPTVQDIDFFKWWCLLLRPFINLTSREMDVIANFLMERWKLSKEVSDPALLDTLLMSDATKNRIIKNCEITQSHFYVVMSKLRKNNVIKDDVINPRLIPNIRETDNGCFQLLILFKDNKKKA